MPKRADLLYPNRHAYRVVEAQEERPMSQLSASMLVIAGTVITACGVAVLRDIDRQHQQRTVSRYALASRYARTVGSPVPTARRTNVERFRLASYEAPMARINEPAGTGSALMTHKRQVIPTAVLNIDGRRRRVPMPAHRIHN